MRTPLLSLLVLLVSVLSSGVLPARTLTSTDGKTIEAEVVGIAAGKVTLLMNGKQMMVPIDRFSEADKEYFREWLAENINYQFQFFVKVSDGQEKRGKAVDAFKYTGGGTGKGDTTVRTKSHAYLIEVSNLSGQKIEDLEVHYRFYINQRLNFQGNWQGGGDLRRGYRIVGGEDGGAVENRKKLSFTTGTTDMVTSQTKVGDGQYAARRNYTETAGGVWIRVMHKGKIVGEYSKWEGELQKIEPDAWPELED